MFVRCRIGVFLLLSVSYECVAVILFRCVYLLSMLFVLLLSFGLRVGVCCVCLLCRACLLLCWLVVVGIKMRLLVVPFRCVRLLSFWCTLLMSVFGVIVSGRLLLLFVCFGVDIYICLLVVRSVCVVGVI